MERAGQGATTDRIVIANINQVLGAVARYREKRVRVPGDM